MLALLRQRNFSLLWFGGLISFTGDWVLFVALPLYIYNLTGSVLATGTLFITSLLPHVLLGSVAGVYVDRWDRRRILIVTNGLRALFLLPLVLVGSADTVWLIYVVSLFTNTARQFSTPAENALLPRLVGEENLVPANALNSLNNNLARLAGPAFGGVLFATLGFSASVLVDIATFLVAGVLIALISAPASVTKAEVTEDAAAPNAWREWVDGLRVVRHNPIVGALFVVLCINSLGEGMLGVLFAPFVKDVVGGGANEFGWLISAQAVGGLLGSLVVGGIWKKVPAWQLVALNFIALGLVDLLIFNIPILIVGIIFFALAGLPVAGLQVGAQTLFQTSVDDRFRGRVMGAFATTSALAMLAGQAIATFTGDVLPIVPFLSAEALLNVVAGLAALWLLRPPASKPAEDRGPRELVGNTTSD
ncbi:MAG TPA: MFS transporter [Chloroflexia bacterium]|nr:MFS transporter [Chloroflexia bacterium]